MRNLYCLLGLLAAWVQTGAAAAQTVDEIDRVVAIVNEDVIVMTELDARIRIIVDQLRQSGTRAPPLHVLQRQVLERLILDRLQLQVADRTGIRIDENMLNRAVSEIARKNGLGLREFRQILERDGYDFASFREDIRNEIRISEVRQRQVSNRVKVSQREIRNFLDMAQRQSSRDAELRLGHILIATPEAASPDDIAEARAKATRVREQLLGGADFAQTAVAVSDGQQALEGGDLGWRRMSQLPTIFAEEVTGMAPGDLSGLIRSPSGFHIIKILEGRGVERHIVVQTHARHILIRVDELTDSNTARTRLTQLKQRIEGGADFAELARSNSDDPGSASRGGDLGWVSPGDMVPQFEQVMKETYPGTVSAPFRTQFGWHIIQVLERRDHDSTEEFRRSQAVEQIRQRKLEEELQTWLRQLRDEAYVELRLDQ